MNFRSLFSAIFAVAACLAPVVAQAQGVGPNFKASAEPYEPQDAFAASARLGRGLNILSDDPGWYEPAKSRILPTDFELIRSAGFNSVRFELKAFLHMNEGDVMKPAFLQRLDAMLMAALKAGLAVIIDEHDYNRCATDVDACRRRLTAFWTHIAHRYRDAPNRVMFEILNEPNPKVTRDIWNDMFPELLEIIRRENPTRNVVIDSVEFADMDELPHLRLPAQDSHIIASFHYYRPMRFTHQGASWYRSGTVKDVSWGTPADIRQVEMDMETVANWSKKTQRPVFLGEFGAFDTAPLDMRALWTATVARAASERNIPWAYHQFDQEFRVYDQKKREWIAPLLNALVPSKK